MFSLIALCLLAQGLPPVIVYGNEVLPDDVYRTVLTLSSKTSSAARPSEVPGPRWAALVDRDPEAAAAQIKDHVLDFLLASGYELAHVEVRITPTQVELHIDEGRLDKVIFLREGTFSNIELKFALHLPGEIFNRPLLEEKLDLLVRDSNITAAYYELVPTERVAHAGIQVEEPKLIHGLRLLNPGANYELHIRLQRSVPKAGLNLGLGLSGSEGFYVKAGFREGDVIFGSDRLELGARVGVYLGQEVSSSLNPLGISRVQGILRWSPLPLGYDDVRTFVVLEGNLFGRPRNDLTIANYYFVPVAAGLVFDAVIFENFNLSLGGGVEHRSLFGVDDGDQGLPALGLTPKEDLRFYLHASTELVFNPKELRADRTHRLQLSVRFLSAGTADGTTAITKAILDYENTITFGWDELRLGFRAAHFFGTVPFYEELSINDGFLRSGFGTQIWLRRGAAINLEYRLSLSRDTLKLSVFNDVAGYERLDERRQSVDYAVADTFGAGVNVLLFDAFQINTYLGLTVDQHLGLDLGVKAELTRAF